jgi:dTDP-glucose 4,6-dehydratase
MSKPEDYYEFVENRIGQDVRYAVEATKIRALGWNPKMTLDKYLPELIQMYKNKYE